MISSTLRRVLEPEVMDTPEEARDYNAIDHSTVNRAFCDDVFAAFRAPQRILDVGTGTAHIPIEFCTRAPDLHVTAIDLAEHMLALGKQNVANAGLTERVTLEKVDAKKMPYASGAFDAVVSNSIVHHIPEPSHVLNEMWRVTATGGLLFVRDLVRPPNDQAVEQLVALYFGSVPTDPYLAESFTHQRGLFRASLEASLTIPEVAAHLRSLGIPETAVRMTSDRHWTISIVKS